MASEFKFGSPEWRAKYMKRHAGRPASTSGSVASSVTNGVKTVRLRNGKVLQFGVKSKNPFAKLKSWQIALAAAGGVLVLQHLLAAKGTSIVSKVFGGSKAGGEHAGHYVGAVNRGGYGGNSGMPFGPGPWPTQHAVENGHGSTPLSTTLPQAPMDGTEATGWGHMEMPSPFGRGGPPFGMGYGGGGGHGGWPYGGAWWE